MLVRLTNLVFHWLRLSVYLFRWESSLELYTALLTRCKKEERAAHDYKLLVAHESCLGSNVTGRVKANYLLDHLYLSMKCLT